MIYLTGRDEVMANIHRSAENGFSASSLTYQSGRPGYPKAVSTWLSDELQIGAGDQLLDLGAGTGKFTRLLVETGAHIVAVEPVREMLDLLRRSYPTVEAREGTAETIPSTDASLEAVFCAQAFHWFASQHVMAEIHRVLRPGGVLGLIWNMRDQSVRWVAELSRIMAPYEAGTPRFHDGHWRSVFPAEGFSALEEVNFAHAHQGDFQTVLVDRILSVSFIASLPLNERARVEAEIRKLTNTYPELARAEVSFPYRTFATWCRKY